MAQGDKRSYSAKQKRKAAHIEASYRKRGLSEKSAEERAWRTVNKQDGGAKGSRSGSSRKSAGTKPRQSSASRKSSGTRKTSSGRKTARGRSTARARSR